MEWSEARIEELRVKWFEFYPPGSYTPKSTRRIAEEMHISKNAVVGKAHRLGLEARPSPIRPAGEPKPIAVRAPRATQTLPPLPSQPHLLPGAPPRPVIVAPPKPPPPVKYGRITECCWPIGESPRIRYCDAPSEPGKPYCAIHAKRAYVTVPKIQAEATT